MKQKILISRIRFKTGEITQLVKELASKPDNVSLISGTDSPL